MRKICLAIALASIAGAANAQETVTYSYDALGRLVATSVSGGPNSGMSTATGFDASGNRTSYTATNSSGPISVADYVSATALQACSGISLYPLANDYDPSGFPLQIVAFSSNDLQIDGDRVYYSPFPWSEPGIYTATYTIRNSNNQTSDSTITIEITGSSSRSCD